MVGSNLSNIFLSDLFPVIKEAVLPKYTRSLVVSDLRLEIKGVPVRVRLLAMCRCELPAVITRLMPKRLSGRWKLYREVK